MHAHIRVLAAFDDGTGERARASAENAEGPRVARAVIDRLVVFRSAKDEDSRRSLPSVSCVDR